MLPQNFLLRDQVLTLNIVFHETVERGRLTSFAQARKAIAQGRSGAYGESVVFDA